MNPLHRIRIASFNLALDRAAPGVLAAELSAGGNRQIRQLVEILQRVRPDIVLLSEFDHDGDGRDDGHLRLFCDGFLARGGEDVPGLDYPYRWLVPTNTGKLAPVSLTGQALPRLPQDGLGFGHFHGQYGLAVLSRWPLLLDDLRSFQHFLWQDMPGARLPVGPEGPWFTGEALRFLPLSSKNHVDLPVRLPNGRKLHLLACHPAPPIDEGPERRNSCRNHDELRLFQDYIHPDRGAYLVDDRGLAGGLAADADFVLLGDLNADPNDGDGFRAAIGNLLASPALNYQVARGSRIPASLGGYGLKGVTGRQGSPAYWTHSQGLRLDYVLPSRRLRALASGVYWYPPAHPLGYLFWDKWGWPDRRASSDHRLVWVDVAVDT
ncbi:endonuclease/exonuclease/phosphatase family protein [Zobellella aerophila]|uniref:Endonuclease/exonuclease/phosphatase family protein n=1 Tax=Zobellella aerophila TaxID=870480 RepID=A0ABP6WJ82_9GAMM